MRCAFCINWCIEGSRWRTRSSAQVLQEIKALRSEYGSRAFRLAGTHSPPRFVREICSQIISEHLDVEFGLYLHAKGVTGDLLDMLKEAGCFGVFFGVESGSDEILARSMNKSTDVANLHHVLTSSIRRGLFTAGSFIFPAPFETELTEKCTKEFIVDVFYEQPNAAAILIFPGLLPGTLWWKNRERFGFELTVDEDFYRRILSSYKIRHLIPPIFWDPLPYTLNGQTQPELARRNAALQQWARQLGIAVNLGDHDVQVGVALGYEPFAFKEELVRLFFTGDGEAIQELVDRSNEVLAK